MSSDPYTDPDSQSHAAVDAMMTRLEERGQHPEFLRMIQNYVASLPIDRPLSVMDLGCGTGVVTRQLLQQLHPESQIRGTDVSAALLAKARELNAGGRISWDHVPAGPLSYRNGQFEAVTMHTLLSHVPDPVSLLREAHRVLKPGGRLIVFDADHAGTTYGQKDYETTRRIDHLLATAIATHPDVCRRMPRFLKETRFRLESHRADVLSECGRGQYWLSSVRGFARLIPALGILAPGEAAAWVDHMITSHEEGTFFAAGAFYTFHAVRE